jgi:hypothetical protein
VTSAVSKSLKPMVEMLWHIFGPFVLGVLGWVAVNFVGKPYLEFLTLKKEIHEELIIFWYVHPPADQDHDVYGEEIPPEAYREAMRAYSDARETIRRLGSKLSALNVSLTRPLSYWLSWRGYKVQDAANGLLRLSTEFDYADRTLLCDSIERFLRLPYSYPRSYIEQIREGRAARQQPAVDPPS